MTVNKNQAIQSDPSLVSSNPMRYARGQITLVLGAAVDNVRGFSATASLQVTRLNPAGGIGNLSALYNAATGNISIASDDATEASDVQWLLVD
jgi:expansin (peptidoglycan-binding protein)